MIITRTPFRCSLFGGGTDYPAWFREHGGAVLGLAIDKYCWVSVRHLPPFFPHRTRVVYSKVETVTDNREIEHPVVRALLADTTDGLEIHHDADLPAKSGLGSSSAFVVGLAHALARLRKLAVSPHLLARRAIDIEQKLLGESVGCQDQVWAAHGGFGKIEFMSHGTDYQFRVSDMLRVRDSVNRACCERLASSLLLVFTGFSRFSSGFAADQIANLKQRTTQLRRMRELVDEALAVIDTSRQPLVGEMLHESWMLKRELADTVSTPAIDALYMRGLAAGATGGKLLGAGGGGFMLFYVEPELRAAVKRAMAPRICVDFGIDRDGSKVVVNGVA